MNNVSLVIIDIKTKHVKALLMSIGLMVWFVRFLQCSTEYPPEALGFLLIQSYIL